MWLKEFEDLCTSIKHIASLIETKKYVIIEILKLIKKLFLFLKFFS